jgi:hypothetical protein
MCIKVEGMIPVYSLIVERRGEEEKKEAQEDVRVS